MSHPAGYDYDNDQPEVKLDFLSIVWDHKPRVLLVEDSKLLQETLAAFLGTDYNLFFFETAESALLQVEEINPDIFLLDILLPGMSGLQMLTFIRSRKTWAEVPVIMMTAVEDIESKRTAFSGGASDYITVPYEPEEVRIRVRAQLQMAAVRQYTVDQNRRLKELVHVRTQQVSRVRDATIMAFSSLAETRDNETGQHVKRTMKYMERLLSLCYNSSRLSAELEGKDHELIAKSAPLHDIGKVGIPDAILLKPAELTADERRIMETHTILGRNAILKAEEQAGTSSYLLYARLIAMSHHEKWDGSGYPEGLSGRTIPVEARLMAVCDVYDALINKRVYKKAFSQEVSLEIMRKGRGLHFDPELLDLFLQHISMFQKIALDLSDGE